MSRPGGRNTKPGLLHPSRLFSARNGSPLEHGNLRTRVLTPLLKKLI
jgi:hypothetical protein